MNIRGKSANLPAITERDWLDIKFGVDVGVDYYALSFVRNADVIYELKRYLAQQGENKATCRPPLISASSTTDSAISADTLAMLPLVLEAQLWKVLKWQCGVEVATHQEDPKHDHVGIHQWAVHGIGHLLVLRTRRVPRTSSDELLDRPDLHVPGCNQCQ